MPKSSVTRQRNAQRTRASILAAARLEFSRGGFAGTRVAAIARRAGVNTSLVFYYFQNKEGLYRAMSDQRIDAYALPHAGPEAREDLFQWPRWLFALGDNTREAVRYLMREGIGDLAAEAPLPDEQRRRASFLRQVARVRAAQAAGHLPNEFDAAQLTLFLYVLGVYPYVLPQTAWLATGAGPDEAAFRTRFATFVSDLASAIVDANSDFDSD